MGAYIGMQNFSQIGQHLKMGRILHHFPFISLKSVTVFSCDSSSIGHNVCLLVYLSATSFMELLFCGYILHFLAVIAALYVTMSACWSICQQRVLWKCYALVSVRLLLLLL